MCHHLERGITSCDPPWGSSAAAVAHLRFFNVLANRTISSS